MRYLLLTILLMSSLFMLGQSNVDIRGDSIRIYKVGGNAELVVRNATRNLANSFLQNLGNGVTSFAIPRYVDSISADVDSIYFWNKTLALRLGAVKPIGGGRISGDTLFIGTDTLLLTKSFADITGDAFDNTNLYAYFYNRGLPKYATTGDLATVNVTVSDKVIVEGVGILEWSATGPADGVTYFPGLGGFWKVILRHNSTIFENGLVKVLDTVRLGAALNRHTTVTLGAYNFSYKTSSGDSVSYGSLGYGGTPSISSSNWLTMLLKGKYLIIPMPTSVPDDADAFPRIQIGVNRTSGYSRNVKYAAVLESFTYSGASASPAVDSNRNKPFMIVTTGFNGVSGGAGDIILRPGVTTGLGSNYDNRYGNFHVKLEPSGTGTVKTPYKQGAVTDSFMVWRAIDSSMRMISASVAGLGDVTTAQLADTAQVLRTAIADVMDSATAEVLYDFGTETSVSKQLGAVVNPGLIKFKTINMTATGGLAVTHGASNTDSIPINISLPNQTGQAGRVLQSDGTTASWQIQSGGITALTGDVTATGTGSVAATIAGNAVTNAKMADMATATIKGRATAATGDPEDLTPSQARTVMNLKYADWDMYEDFHQVLYSSFLQTFNGNGGFMFNVPIAATDQMGVARLYSGTSSAASYTALASGNDGMTFSASTMELDAKDITVGQLNTSTDSAQYIVGFFDNAGSNASPTDGAYFIYESGSTFWKAVTISNGVKTETITPVTVGTGIVNSIDVSIRGNSTSVVFTIYGQTPITHTTNIPSGLDRTFQVGYALKKRLGTAEQFIDVDRFLFKKDN